MLQSFRAAKKDIKLLNEKFAGVEEGKEKFSGTVADMETDFKTNMDAIDKKLDELVKDMNKADEAAKAAKDTGDSYASGLRSKTKAVYNASAALAKASNQGWKDYYQQKSPSKVAMAEAAQTADSYAMGFESRIKHMEDTTAKFALATYRPRDGESQRAERRIKTRKRLLMHTRSARKSLPKKIEANEAALEKLKTPRATPPRNSARA